MFQRELRCFSARFRIKLPVIKNVALVHSNIPNADILDQLQLPTLEFPWPSACSPYVKYAEEEMHQWAIQHNLTANDEHKARLKRAKYGWLVANCYPRADYSLFRILVDYHAWIFLVDDLFVDRVDTIGPQTIQNLTSVIYNLDFNRPSGDQIYGEMAFLDICQRLRLQISHEHFQRFAHGIRMWASSVALQILNHTQPYSVGFEPYKTIHNFTGAMIASFSLIDIANGTTIIPASILYRPDVQKLERIANNVIIWFNDIYSFKTEMHQPGQQHNMVMLYTDQGYSLQQSIDNVAENIRSEIKEFIQLSHIVGENCENELTGYITGLKYWMQGHHDWTIYDSQRYSSDFAKQDADDRGLLTGDLIK